MAQKVRIAIDVILIPPEVEPGAPPIIIRNEIKSFVTGKISSIFIVVNPVVLAVTLVKIVSSHVKLGCAIFIKIIDIT